MLSKLVAVFALTAYVVYAQTTTLNLPVTQDFAVANNGFSGAQVSRPDTLSFFNNGFQSSVSYFGIDLSPLASFDTSTISSATLTFTNFTLSRDSQASIAITLLNYGQVFDESTVSLSTQPTSQGTLGTVLFNSATGVATIDVQNQLKAAQTAGGLFGIRVDPPGGPITIASHRVNPNAVYIAVVFGGATSAPVTTTTTTAPAPTSGPTTTTTTAAPVPGAPSTAAPVPSAPSTARVTTTTTTAAPGSPTTTTTRSPTAGPTSSFAPSSAPTTAGAPNPSTTEAPRSSANKISAALLCIVPLAMALLL